MINLPVTKRHAEFIQFTGGYDTDTPKVFLPPGALSVAQNFEEDINGGYVTADGYERFSGQPKPSNAIPYKLPVSAIGTLVVGNTITGATSGATAKILAVYPTYFVVTKTTGIFVAENSTAGGAVITGAAVASAFSGLELANNTLLAANDYRADIAAVPGSGSILGVHYYNGSVYAFRNTTTTGVGMYKSSTAGWVAVTFGEEISFSNANTSVGDGDTLTQGAVTATISRVVVQTGTLASGVNTGRLIITGRTGGNYGAGAATSTGGGALTLSAIQTAITIPNQGGRFEIITANFTGSNSTARMYGVDGKNRGFEYDGTTFVPIASGLPTDTPEHLSEFKNHLFYSRQNRIVNSAIGTPYSWTAITGAVDIGLSDNCTGFKLQPGGDSTGAMAIFCRNRTYMLYGTDATTWNLVNLNSETGAYPYTIGRIGRTFCLDDRGIITLEAAQEFGNFAQAAISLKVNTWLNGKRQLAVDSQISRIKQQYRLFFSDGSAAYVMVMPDKVSIMPMFFDNPILCSCSTEKTSGVEEIFFGSDNGFVYQMDLGTSFDGAVIDSLLETSYYNLKSYRALKRFHKMTLELERPGYGDIRLSYGLGYSMSTVTQPDETTSIVDVSLKTWDTNNWDVFNWDGISLLPLTVHMGGTGENLSVKLKASSAAYLPVRFSGAFIEYSPLRMLR